MALSSRLSNGNRKKRWKKRPKPYNTPKSEDLDIILGRWEVTKVWYEAFVDEEEELDRLEDGNRGVYLSECEGVEVGFDEQCDITWYIPKGVESIPLFQTTSFNIERDSMDLIGGEDGKTFRFLVESGVSENQLILKTPIDDSYEEEEAGEMVIIINKVSNSIATIVDSFSLKDALEDGFFSDLTIRSSDSVSFPVHRTVLVSSSPKISYREWEILLAGFKATLVKPILEYLYTDILPHNLSLSLAKELISAISANSRLSRLRDLCHTFIESNNLKQRLMGYVDDLQSSLELAKKIVETTEMTNPIKVTYAIKQLAKEAATGAAKLGLLCELYTRNKKDMSKGEKHEVLEYVRGRVVVFVDLLSELIEIALAKFNELTNEEKMEVATYIIPEVERIWDMLNKTSKEMEAVMIAKVTSLHLKSKPHFRRQDIKLAFILQFIARGRELKRLQRIGKEFEDFVMHSHRKREEFSEWTESGKAEKIVRVMDGLEGEGLNQMDQLSDLKKDILVGNVLEWKKFKILVTVCCSYVSWGVRKAQSFKTPLKPVLLKGLKFVQSSDVNDVLVYFDLLDEADLKALRDEDRDVGKTIMPGLHPLHGMTGNLLAQGCHKLLASQDYSDMRFVLVPNSVPSLGTSEAVAGEERSIGDEAAGGVVIHAHRVIVAARCEYFKRALQSGMKEAIDRCIVVHGCEEAVFRTFLYYLYGGSLDTANMSTDDIIELMAVADRYETTSLRGLCEGLLVDRVVDANVFGLLQVADHYSTRRLREMTLQHIIADPNILMSELDAYSNLPEDLKQEIRKLLASINPHLTLRHSSATSCTGPIPVAKSARSDSVSSSRSSSSGSSSSSSRNSSSIGPIGGDHTPYDTSIMDYQNSEMLALQDRLREIVGEGPSDKDLREFILQADMDLNRAANFIFSSDLYGFN